VAQKVQVQLVDDFDGSVADGTVTFGLDGKSYEIDLSAANAQKLRGALAEFVEKARKVGGKQAKAPRVGTRSGTKDLGDVRAWARDNGFQVSDRGRVSSEVLSAYDAAH